MSEDKILSDAIFGFIILKPHIITIIDTLEFQRLRQIWQLGMTPFVYPTADYSRFEHSIGVYWLASRLLSQIQGQIGEKPGITDEEKKCVEIAALCHDIGHGPFSHVWDSKVLLRFLGSDRITHENQFPKMWNILKGNPSVRNMLIENNLEDCEQLICNLITGTVTSGKEVLFSIVSNGKSGLDVDKWDYLARDSTYLGHSSTNYRADIERMIYRARAIKNDEDEWKIAFRDTEKLNMLRVFQLRHYMYQTAYRHRTVVAIEQMFLDGVKECIDKGLLHVNEIGTAAWILKNTDSIFWSNVSEVDAFKRILTRVLYKPILEASKYEIVDDPTHDVKALLDNEQLKNVRIAFCKFKLGNKDVNPIFEIPFYNKDYKISYCREEDLPSYLKLDCDQSRVIIFSTLRTYDVSNVEMMSVKSKLKEYFERHQWKIEDN